MGGTDAEACLYAGITPKTLYNFLQKDPRFAEHRKQLKELPTLKARKTVVESLDQVDSAWKWLEKKDPDFANKNQVTHTFEVKQITPTAAKIIKEADERLLLED